MANYSCHAGHNLGQRNLTAGNTRQNREQQPGRISTRAAALETSNETPKKLIHLLASVISILLLLLLLFLLLLLSLAECHKK